MSRAAFLDSILQAIATLRAALDAAGLAESARLLAVCDGRTGLLGLQAAAILADQAMPLYSHPLRGPVGALRGSLGRAVDHDARVPQREWRWLLEGVYLVFQASGLSTTGIAFPEVP